MEPENLAFLKVGQPIHFFRHGVGPQDGIVLDIINRWCAWVLDESGLECLVLPAEYIYSHPVQ